MLIRGRERVCLILPRGLKTACGYGVQQNQEKLVCSKNVAAISDKESKQVFNAKVFPTAMYRFDLLHTAARAEYGPADP
jgi:hypothetical protein